MAPGLPRHETGGMTRWRARPARALLAALAAALAACLGVTAALAAATWTIKPGGGFTAASGQGTFKDTRTGNSFTCQSLSLTGTLKSGSGLPGPGAGSIPAVGFTNCTSPLNLNLRYPLRATALPWHVSLSSDNSGVVTGTIGHIQVVDKSPGCNFVLDGTGATAGDGHVQFRYTNSSGKLRVLTTGGSLHTYRVPGCAGLVNNGDPVTLAVTFTL